MLESPSDVLTMKTTGYLQETTNMKTKPSIGQVVSKVSDLVSNAQQHSQKRPSNFHTFINKQDSNYISCKDVVDGRNNDALVDHHQKENKEPLLISNDLPPSYDEVADRESIVLYIAAKIEHELKEAKRTSLECGEVLVPCNLTRQIAADVVTMSESEPCGLRGGILFVSLEGGNDTSKDPLRSVGCVKIGDRNAVPTFELYLSLKRTSSWLHQVSNRLFRNFNRDTIVISEMYKLSKKKLYR